MVVSGAVASTVNVRVDGVASTLPAASSARTSKVCSPSASTAAVLGESQGAKLAPSTRHSKLEPGSPDENPNVGVASLVVPRRPGVDHRLRRGGVDREAAASRGSRRVPAPSVARTSKTCAAVSERSCRLRESRTSRSSAPSTRHSKVDVALARGEPERRRRIVRGRGWSGVDRRLRRGGVNREAAARRQSRRDCRQGRWRALRRCARRRRVRRSFVANRMPRSSTLSTRHSKVEPDSLGGELERRRRNRWSRPPGPEPIVVCGAAVSTVKVRLAGVASALPAPSMVRTSKVWKPSPSSAASSAKRRSAKLRAIDPALKARA